MNTYGLKKNEPVRRLQLDCLDYCMINHKIWILGSQTQAVFSMDFSLENLSMEYVITEKDERQRTREIFRFIRKKGDKIFFFPAIGDSIQVVELKTKNIEKINIIDSIGNYNIDEPENVIEYEDAFYLFPAYKNNPLLRFDGKRIEVCNGWMEYMQGLSGTDSGNMTQSVVYEDGKVWMILEERNKLICTILETMQIESYDILAEGYFIDIIGKCGDKFWMAPLGKGKIICWSVEKGIEKEYDVFPEEFSFADKYSFSKIICLKDSIWFLPKCAQDILILDLASDEFVTVHLPKELWRYDAGVSLPRLYTYLIHGNQLILPACGYKYHLVIDLENREIIKKVDAIFPNIFYQKWLENKNVWLMWEYGTEEAFIKYVQEHYHLSENEKKYYLGDIQNSGKCGEIIWKHIYEITERSNIL